MEIIVCCKVVPDDQDITVNPDRSLNFSRANLSISIYDLNALEAAVALVETYGGTVRVLSVGGADIDDSKTKKNILSRGADELIMVADAAFEDMDSYATAQVLKAAIGTMGAYDLVICGAGSADRYAQQTGIQLGQLIGLPTINAVSAVSLDGDKLVLTRTVETATQQLSLTAPAVISVTSDLNLPRIAGMKQILAAGKKPSTVFDAHAVGVTISPANKRLSVTAPEETDRKHDIVEGDGEEQVASFIATVKEAMR